MFCFKCGTKIPNESIFCMNCGEKVPNNSNPISTEETEPLADNNDLYTPEKLYNMFGNKKMDAIKYVAHDSGMSLKEAKNLVESAYKSINGKSNPIQQKIIENKKNGIACCPKCGSTSLSANKKGFGVGKAVVGSAIAGPIGLVAGNKGAKKVRITCLNCGHQWKP